MGVGVGGVLMKPFSIVCGWAVSGGAVPSVELSPQWEQGAVRCLLCRHGECSQGFPTGVPWPQPVAQGCWHCVLAVTETVLEIISAGWARPQHPSAEGGSQDTSPGGLKDGSWWHVASA